jgi:hypothetical protein
MKRIFLCMMLPGIVLVAACNKEKAQSGAAPVTTTPAPTANDEKVLTPGGWRPASQVGLVDKGEHLTIKNDRLMKVSDANGSILKDFGAQEHYGGITPDYPKNLILPPARQAVPLGSGWITYTGWTNSSTTPITYSAATWTVPPAPTTNSGQTIFLFNGLENSSYILQPVLQWGPSAAGGGAYWAIANWYVDGSNGTALHSNLVRVNPGTVLTGIMTQTGTTGSNYNYVSSFSGYSSINLTVNNIAKLFWADETLETYNIATCSNYPNTASTRFSGIEVHVGTAQAPLSWTVYNAVTDCGQHTNVVTNGSPNGIVDIYY